jgi:hypothetical protein
MKFKLQMVIYDEDDRAAALEDIIELDKSSDTGYCAGISLLESKQILKLLQQNIVLKQAQNYIDSHKICPSCFNQLRVKGYHNRESIKKLGVMR